MEEYKEVEGIWRQAQRVLTQRVVKGIDDVHGFNRAMERAMSVEEAFALGRPTFEEFSKS